jgi:tRNA/tmRNA/rRNA uracil-C5-methylase (TrmA/RlmC/RlmD family)
MRRFRSHDVLPVTAMPLMSDALAELDLLGRRWAPGARIEAVAPAGGDAPVVLVDDQPYDLRRGKADPRPNARSAVREQVRVGERAWAYRVAAAGFWQVHREAPAALTGAVLDALGDVDGARVLDLYSGAGLFTLPLADAVGDAGTVVAVEGDARAVRDARRNLHDRPQVELHAGDVAGALAAGAAGAGVDAVVLDPPRVGAGRDVVRAVAALAPRRVVYVACDPAALARDVAYLAEEGYGLADVTGYDLFPMTHHVEAVAVLER